MVGKEHLFSDHYQNVVEGLDDEHFVAFDDVQSFDTDNDHGSELFVSSSHVDETGVEKEFGLGGELLGGEFTQPQEVGLQFLGGLGIR